MKIAQILSADSVATPETRENVNPCVTALTVGDKTVGIRASPLKTLSIK